MTEETALEAPNWLKELEAKREKRLVARLGHETGAGAPCLTCKDKCPGLVLHFWRKTCKECKCSKESHDVPDDDIYGWAEWQLLGTKPNKIKTKIVLPGRKDEVEVEWAPKGQKDTVEDYLKTLSPDKIPIKGSQAAQDRKQMLQKQIPIYDIDPTMCHELTPAELKQMNEYIAHVKEKSVGVGQLVNVNSFLRGSVHNLDPIQMQLLTQRYGKNIPISEIVKLQSQNVALTKLAKDVDKVNLQNYNPHQIRPEEINLQPTLNKIVDKTYQGYAQNYPLPHQSRPEEVNLAPTANKIVDKYPGYANVGEQNLSNVNFSTGLNSGDESVGNLPRHQTGLPNYVPGKYDVYNDNHNPQALGNVKDLIYSTYDQNSGHSPNHNQYYPRNIPNRFEEVLQPNQVNIGAISDINPDIIAQRNNPQPTENVQKILDSIQSPKCHFCKQQFEENEFAVVAEKIDALFHPNCLKCVGCNQILADNMYFYHKETDSIYCLRDFAKVRGIPRCGSCDELIFTKEYCLTEESTFHLKHFCCIECDTPLAGKQYLLENGQPICLPCFEIKKASKCAGCKLVIKPHEDGLTLQELHFHVRPECFCCMVCATPLLNKKVLLRNQKLYCSHDCYNSDK